MWVFEIREEECKDGPKHDQSFWLDMKENEFFILQHKIKEVNTKQHKETKGSFKNSGGGGADINELLVHLHSYSADLLTTTKATTQQLENTQFRVTTKEVFTKDKVHVVVAVSDDPREIEKSWNFARNVITTNLLSCGYNTKEKLEKYKDEFLEFLIIHISALYNLRLSSNSNNSNNNNSNNSNSNNSTERSQSLHKPKLQYHPNSMVQQNEINLSSTYVTKKFKEMRKKSAGKDVYLASEDFTNIFKLKENLIAEHHCLILTPTHPKLRESQNTSKCAVLVGTLWVSERHICFFSRSSPNDIHLKFPILKSEIFAITNNEVSNSYNKKVLILQSSKREFRFIGIKNIESLLEQTQHIRLTLISKHLNLINQKSKSSTNSSSSSSSSTTTSSSSSSNLIIKWFSKKGKHSSHTVSKVPIYNFPFSIFTSNQCIESIGVSLTINADPSVQGTIFLFENVSIFISDCNILVILMYDHIVAITENSIFETIILLDNLSSRLLMKFPNFQARSLFINQWLFNKNTITKLDQCGFFLCSSKYDHQPILNNSNNTNNNNINININNTPPVNTVNTFNVNNSNTPTPTTHVNTKINNDNSSNNNNNNNNDDGNNNNNNNNNDENNYNVKKISNDDDDTESERMSEKQYQLLKEAKEKKTLHQFFPGVEDSYFVTELWERYSSLYGYDVIRTSLYRNIIRSGIPNHLRGKIWRMTSGVKYRQRYGLGEVPYQYLLETYANQSSVSTMEIQLDLHRTLTSHPYYQTEEGISSLHRILSSFSWRNTSIGYCQSMNVIAALLLLFMNEENTFVFLCCICEELLPKYYSQTMEGSLIDQQVLRSLLEKYLPSVHSHLCLLEVPIAVITLPWFLCLFINLIPWPASLRVLDVFFSEGRKTLFLISLAIFKLFEKDILLAKDGIEVILLMKTLLNVVDADKLIITAFGEFGEISSNVIDRLYHAHRPRILREIRNNQIKSVSKNRGGSVLHSSNNINNIAEEKMENNNNSNSPRQKQWTYWLISKSFKLLQTNDVQKVLSGIENKFRTSLFISDIHPEIDLDSNEE